MHDLHDCFSAKYRLRWMAMQVSPMVSPYESWILYGFSIDFPWVTPNHGPLWAALSRIEHFEAPGADQRFWHTVSPVFFSPLIGNLPWLSSWIHSLWNIHIAVYIYTYVYIYIYECMYTYICRYTSYSFLYSFVYLFLIILGGQPPKKIPPNLPGSLSTSPCFLLLELGDFVVSSQQLLVAAGLDHVVLVPRSFATSPAMKMTQMSHENPPQFQGFQGASWPNATLPQLWGGTKHSINIWLGDSSIVIPWRILPSRIPGIKSPPLIHWNLGFPKHMGSFFLECLFRLCCGSQLAFMVKKKFEQDQNHTGYKLEVLLHKTLFPLHIASAKAFFCCQDAVQNLIAQHSRKNLNQFQQHAFIFLCGCFYNPYGIPWLLPSSHHRMASHCYPQQLVI